MRSSDDWWLACGGWLIAGEKILERLSILRFLSRQHCRSCSTTRRSLYLNYRLVNRWMPDTRAKLTLISRCERVLWKIQRLSQIRMLIMRQVKREKLNNIFRERPTKTGRCWLIILSLRKLQRWSLSRGIILEEFFLIDEFFFFFLDRSYRLPLRVFGNFFKSSVVIAHTEAEYLNCKL